MPKVSGTFDIFDEHVFVGELDLGISFTYGLFGYGYSAQVPPEICVPHLYSFTHARRRLLGG